MSMDHSFIIQLRWVFPVLGLALLFFRFSMRLRAEQAIERNFAKWTWALGGVYFGVAAIAKWSQFRALVLNSQDFWLFEDMLKQMGQGAPFLTRFAPQALGFVQHGVIHPTFILYFALPWAAILGSTGTALLFGPGVLAAAGVTLAFLARARWGAVAAWCLGAAFLFSSQAGKILTYDVHPEAAYPLLILGAAWILSSTEDLPRRRRLAGVTALVFFAGMSIKEDAFLVFGPLALWYGGRHRFKNFAWVPALAVVLGLAFQFHAISQWKNHLWGPELWAGQPIVVPVGADFLKGMAWDSMRSVFRALQLMIASQGGVGGASSAILHFFLSRPFLSLVLWVPWVVRFPGFWFCIAPLALAHAILGGLRASLILYYSAPFLGVFVFWALRERKPSNNKALWALGVSLFVGSGGPEIYFRSPLASELAQGVAKLEPCLLSKSGNALFQNGIVTTPFLGLVSRDSVATDRVPSDNSPFWNRVDHVLFAPDWPRWETSAQDLERLRLRVTRGSEWIRMEAEGSGCIEVAKAKPGRVQLFVRKPH